MRPTFSIIANGQNITNLINGRLLSLQVTDKAGIKSDLLTLTLDDCDHKIDLPIHGAELECYIGYEGYQTDRVGFYVVDEVELSAPPAVLVVRAHAADMRRSLKSNRDQTYENITLGELLSTIANRHGLVPKITNELDALRYDIVNQSKESDINLLTRLTKEQDAITSIKDVNLIITAKSKGETVSGQTLNPIYLKQRDLSNWRVTIADRQAYQSVTARYHDPDQAKEVIVTAGTGMPHYAIKKNYKNQAEALAAANAKYKQFQRGTRKLSLTLPYKSGLMAEVPIVLNDIRDGVDGEWVIDEARHELSGQGIITKITATPKE